MACDRVREPTNFGVSFGLGGVRASMERRWLINAKSTVMRQKKWQEIRMQKEVEEQRMKAEILQRRKRERARLAAYIHSTTQPPAKCASIPKPQRNDEKRLNWNNSLLRDQELILRMRENARAVADSAQHRRYYSTTTPVINVRSSPQLGGHYPHSRKESLDSDEAILASVLAPKDISEKHYFTRDTCSSDKFSQVDISAAQSAKVDVQYPINNHRSDHVDFPAKCPAKCEIAVNTSATWAPNVMTWEVNLTEDHQSPSILRSRKPSTPYKDQVSNLTSELQPGSSLDGHVEQAEPRLVTESGASCAEQFESGAQCSSLKSKSRGQGASSVRTSRNSACDLRDEILRARLANEAATARLIAEVTAIESRLEDCNLDFQEDENMGFAADLQKYSNADPVNSDSGSEIESRSPSDHARAISGPATYRPAETKLRDKKNSLKGQQASHNGQKEVPIFLHPPPAPKDLDWDTGMFVLSQQSKAAGLTQANQGKMHLEAPQDVQQPVQGSPVPESSVHLESADEMGCRTNGANTEYTDYGDVPPECSQTYKEANRRVTMSSNPKQEGIDRRAPGAALRNGKDIVCCPQIRDDGSEVPSVRTSSVLMTGTETTSAWDINWEQVPEPECHLSLQTGRPDIKPHYKKSSTETLVSHHVDVVRLEIDQNVSRGAKFGHSRPQAVPVKQVGGDQHRFMLEGPTLLSKCIDMETTQPSQRYTSVLQLAHDDYTHPAQETFHTASVIQSTGPPRLHVSPHRYSYENESTDSRQLPGNEENYCQSQSGSLAREEQNIFASLERLDWKLAALTRRCSSVGRESLVSQGQCSIKSAPAVMAQEFGGNLEHGFLHPKRPIPYSTLPPRPSTPQVSKTQKVFPRRRVVGLTNKSGKIHPCCPRTQTGK